jgi:hypothetical protein
VAVQKIDNEALQKLIMNYNNRLHGTTKQISEELHTQKDPKMVKGARLQTKQKN